MFFYLFFFFFWQNSSVILNPYDFLLLLLFFCQFFWNLRNQFLLFSYVFWRNLFVLPPMLLKTLFYPEKYTSFQENTWSDNALQIFQDFSSLPHILRSSPLRIFWGLQFLLLDMHMYVCVSEGKKCSPVTLLKRYSSKVCLSIFDLFDVSQGNLQTQAVILK